MNFQMVIPMNKRSVRSFAFGLFVAVAFIGASEIYLEEQPDTSVKEAKALLEKEGFVTLSESEYNKLKEKNTEQVEKEEKSDKTKEKIEPPATEEEIEEKVEEPVKEEVEKTTYYHLEITSGMYINEIARRLVEANIIKDKNEFEQFLIDHNYNTKLQVGVFELHSLMDYEEIAKIITKSK